MLRTTISLVAKILLVALALLCAGTASADVAPFLVKDINTLATGASDPRDFTQVGSTTFFVATALDTGEELWVTDGTVTGTRLVKDIYPGTVSSSPVWLTDLGGQLYFRARGSSTGLWVSDGTEAGTVEFLSAYVSELTVFNGDLYFAQGGDLYKHTVSPAGTVMVKDFGGSQVLRDFVVSGAELFFVAADASGGVELWKSDGTQGGHDDGQGYPPRR